MKRHICFTLTLAAVIISGCGTVGLKAHLGEEVTLSPGQHLTITGEDLQVRFIGVSGDSRCPRGVYCIWAGEVTCKVEVTHAGTSTEITLTEPGLREAYSTTAFESYALTFHVTPYPDVQKGDIAPGEYRLHLILTKPTPLTSIIGSILVRPMDFSGKEVTIVGYYRGWDLLQEANTPPPVTRSDWVIKDLSGAIYVSAASKAKIPEALQPGSLESTNTILEVRGTVQVTTSGQPYIEAISIKRLP